MLEKLEIRTADAPPLTRGFVVFLFAIILGCISTASFVALANNLHAVLVSFAGLCIWLFLLRRQGRIERFLRKQHSGYVQAQKGFCCQECKKQIDTPIKHQNKHGEPILYHCDSCSILWFTGSVDHSTA
uniref:Ypar19 n=1 Tax=Aquipseudomonas alcaligenes TaxID=43263 RepID=Q939F4_AQUAC|nr:Ypar19 [Pseudomonas alcaligenes]